MAERGYAIPPKPWYRYSLGQLFTIGRGGSHDGRDVQTPSGTPLTSLLGGVVTSHSGFYPWGGEVDIRTPYGVTETFAHLDALAVRPGQVIQPGGFIGLSGGENLPAKYSSGPHTHYSLFGAQPWNNASTFDPTGLLNFVGEGGMVPGLPGFPGGAAGTSVLTGNAAATGRDYQTVGDAGNTIVNVTVNSALSTILDGLGIKDVGDFLWGSGLVLLGGLLILAGVVIFILPNRREMAQAAGVLAKAA